MKPHRIAAPLVGGVLLASFAHAQRNATPFTTLPPQAQGSGGLVVTDLTGSQTPDDLVTTLLGPGVLASNISYSGEAVAAGSFVGGTGIIGFEEGVVLTTGAAAVVQGPLNQSDSTTVAHFGPGDPDLDVLAGFPTFDACILEFDFECTGAQTVSFQFVFASEEYNEFVGTSFNDVFAFFLNGTNIGLVPGTMDPVTINNVNCGNPFGPPAGSNCGLYINNSCVDLGLSFPCTNIETEMDGLTQVFSAVGSLQPGVNTIRLAIADSSDEAYDSAVFIRGESITCEEPAPAFEPPTPCDEFLRVDVGGTLTFDAVAIATNGQPGQGVSIDATGDPAPLTGGAFTPGLPTSLAQPAMTSFSWTPTATDVGQHTLVLIATDQLGQTAECEIDILVEPSNRVGDSVCDPGVPNSTGNPGRTWGIGSNVASNNMLTLLSADLPLNSTGFYIVSQQFNIVMNPGGSTGNICISSPAIGRYDTSLLNSGSTGSVTLPLDLTSTPLQPGGPVSIVMGETWYWQYWHRDLDGMGGATSNFTNAIRVQFQ